MYEIFSEAQEMNPEEFQEDEGDFFYDKSEVIKGKMDDERKDQDNEKKMKLE